MSLGTDKNVIDGIVENEFKHIQKTAADFESENLEYSKAVSNTEIIREALNSNTTEEQQRLIRNLEDSIAGEWTELCQFYFREGLRAGLSNLKFLNGIDNIEYLV